MKKFLLMLLLALAIDPQPMHKIPGQGPDPTKDPPAPHIVNR